MVKALIDGLIKLCECNPEVVVLIADDKEVYDALSEKYPERTINVGIAECNAISMAAGLASCNCIPYVVGGNTFVAYRAYEFIRNQLCMQKRNVKVIGVGAGMAISVLGNTQHATEDVGALRALPNLTVMTPATPASVKNIVIQSLEIDGPAFIRIGRASGRDFYENEIIFRICKMQEIKKGKDIAVFTMGSIAGDVLKAEPILRQRGIDIGIIDVHTVKPLDTGTMKNLYGRYKKWISIEEHNVIGGLGSALSEAIVEEGFKVTLKKMGLEDTFAKGHGTYDSIKCLNKLGVEDIIQACIDMERV